MTHRTGLLLGVLLMLTAAAAPAMPQEAVSGADAGKASQAAAPPQDPATETARIRRLNDTVAVRQGDDRIERILYPFDPTADLAPGDELEQGSGGQSTIVLAAGGLVKLYMSGHMIVERLGEQGDVLRFPTITLAEIEAGNRPLEIHLPGGTTCAFEAGVMTVRIEPGRLFVRNDGGTVIEVTGVLTLEAGQEGGDGLATLMVGRGEEVHLPLFRSRATPLGNQLGAWDELSLRHSGGFGLEPSEGDLWVRPSEAEARDVLTVGGVRVRVEGDESLLLRRGRSGARLGPGSPPAVPAPAVAQDAGPPPGFTAISLEEYYQVRLIALQSGLDEAQIEQQLSKRRLWVSPEVKVQFKEWVSSRASRPADDSTPVKEGSSP